MICYKDRRWCIQKCANVVCERNMTPEEYERAVVWWTSFNYNGEVPIDQSDLKDTPGCVASGGYIEP